MKTKIQIYTLYDVEEITTIEVPEDTAVFLRLAGVISEDISHVAQYEDTVYIRHQVQPEEFEQLVEQFELDTATLKGKIPLAPDQCTHTQRLQRTLSRHWTGYQLEFTDELERFKQLPPRADLLNEVWDLDFLPTPINEQYWKLFEGEDPAKIYSTARNHRTYWEWEDE